MEQGGHAIVNAFKNSINDGHDTNVIPLHGQHLHHIGNSSYTSAPIPSFTTQGYLPPGDPQSYYQHQNPKKKQVRATQACSACRQRKQKCNEANPCDSCEMNGLECQYKDLPPPKSDRTLNQILDEMTHLDSISKQLLARFENIEKHQLVKGSGHGSCISLDRPSGDQMTDDDVISGDPAEEPNNLTNPKLLTTASLKLLEIWPTMLPFCQDTLDEGEMSYPLQLEERRGCLRPYGRGQGLEAADTTQQIGSPVGTAKISDAADVASTESFWGAGYYNSTSLPVKDGCQTVAQTIDCIDSEMYMKLDKNTIQRLYDSFCRHMYDPHPFLNKAWLTKIIINFANTHNPSSEISLSKSVPSTFTNIATIGSYAASSARYLGKRKRSAAGPASVPPHDGAPSKNTYKLPQRCMINAIVLLILALGKICEHKGPLPSIPGDGVSTEPQKISSLNVESQPISVKQSPSSSQKYSSPVVERRMSVNKFRRPMVGVYSQKQSSSAPAPTSERPIQPKNLEVIPGLEYYAYASDILGNLRGGLQIVHAQACLLAALYHGQLARVLEAYVWIQKACDICRWLFLKNQEILSPSAQVVGPEAANLDSIKLVFWEALQLESDILAVLDLPSSSISSLYDKVGLPWISEHSDRGSDEEYRHMVYSAHIALRKLLNRFRDNLNNGEFNKKTSSKHFEGVFEIFQSSIKSWRYDLPVRLQWADENFQSDNIIKARLRAAYYGALYTTTRLVLQSAVTMQSQFPILKRDYVILQDMRKRYLEKNPSGNFNFGETGKTTNINRESIWILKSCEACVKAAISNIIVFDKVPGVLEGRIIVTNVFTTAHAQFRTCLVLAATWNSWLESLVSEVDLIQVLSRTISFLQKLAPLSPGLQKDAMILESTRTIISSKLDAKNLAFAARRECGT